MTDDRSGASVVRPDETRITAAATDWRTAAQMLGPRDATWSLPLIDVLLGAACLLIVLSPLSFISRFGAHAVYVADLVLEIVLALAQPLRRRMPRTSFVITAVALALYALLTYFSPVPLGLSPLTLTALTSLHAVARWCPERRWGRTALGAALVSCLYVLYGVIAVAGYETIGAFLLPSGLWTLALDVPLLPLLGVPGGWWLWCHPLQPAVVLIEAAFGARPVGAVAPCALLGTIWCALLALAARARLVRAVTAKGAVS